MLKYSLPALVMGFVLDLLIGDPRWLYHPICCHRQSDRSAGKSDPEDFSEKSRR